MSKRTKIWLITAAALVLIGCILFGGVMTVLNWNFGKLSTVKYETGSYVIKEAFENISVISDTADIVFVSSDNSQASVVCYERENAKHLVEVKDGTLRVELSDTRKWYEHIGISFGSPEITVYLPKGEYGALFVKNSTGDVDIFEGFGFESIDVAVSTGDVLSRASASALVKIKTSTGKIDIENISAGMLELSTSTGKVTALGVICEGNFSVGVTTGKATLVDITCKNFTTKGTTGDVALNNLVAKEKLSVKRNTGDVDFEGCDAGEISVVTTTGRVKGSFLSEKVIFVKTDTGKVDIPKSVNGGRCDITTDTGSIRISICE